MLNELGDVIIADMVKTFGDRSAMYLGDPSVSTDVPYWLSTGSSSLDLSLGGGLPAGRIVEIHGAESTAKSSFCASLIAEHQKLGGIAVLLDPECAFNPKRATQMGVDVEKVIYLQPNTMEVCFDMITLAINRAKVVKDPKPLLIIWDSLTATPTKAELDAETGASLVAVSARLQSQEFKKLNKLIANSKAILVCVNQIRDVIGGGNYGPNYTVGGGYALKFYASVRLRFMSGAIDYDNGDPQSGTAIGQYFNVQIKKNKVYMPYKNAKIYLNYTASFDDNKPLWFVITDKNLLGKAGSWYTLHKEDGTEYKKFQGMNAYLKLMDTDPEFRRLVYLKADVPFRAVKEVVNATVE